jgi:hypothetical protein
LQILATTIGVLILGLGLSGFIVPEGFAAFVAQVQRPPLLYAAAVVRVVVGIILVLASFTSRAGMALRVLGILIILGGLLTPFLGASIAKQVLAWWAKGGAEVVRAWALLATSIGAFIVYSAWPKRK